MDQSIKARGAIPEGCLSCNSDICIYKKIMSKRTLNDYRPVEHSRINSNDEKQQKSI
jgi:hypothetical protein